LELLGYKDFLAASIAPRSQSTCPDFGNCVNRKNQQKAAFRNLVKSDAAEENGVMISPFFLDFLQHIAVGAGLVFALLLVIWVSTPRRSLQETTLRTPH
jgi:hypothetical protein